MNNLPQISNVVSRSQQMLKSVQESELGSKSKEIMGTISEDAPVLREAFGEISTEPKNAFAKIATVAKNIWAKIMEVGFFGAIVNQFKALFAVATNVVAGGTNDEENGNVTSSNRIEALALDSASASDKAVEAPANPAAPVNAGDSQPLLSGEKA